MVLNVDVYQEYPLFRKSKYDQVRSDIQEIHPNKTGNVVRHTFRGEPHLHQLQICKHSSLPPNDLRPF
jgi:hypothetical protein